jgi:NADH dehydrogenase
MELMERKMHILILGGGYGGLACAQNLDRFCKKYPNFLKNFEIFLIDQHDYQLFTPTIYEIATTHEEVANALELKKIVAIPLVEAIRGTRVIFVQQKITAIDAKEKFVTLSDGSRIDFEYLVIALGTETNYFGIPGLKEYSYPLKNLYDALRIRDAILTLFSSASNSLEGGQDPQLQLSFLIAGAGPTGVELSGELSRWITHLTRHAKKPCTCSITLIDAAPNILPGFGEKIVRKARKRLARLGVAIKTGTALKEVSEGKVLLANGEWLTFDLLVWAGGVKAPDILATLPHKIEKRGRPEVTPEMYCVSTNSNLDFGGKFFAIGDAACFYYPEKGYPIPGVARAAIEQGKVVAYNILADLKNSPKKTYKPLNYPFIIPIGGRWAIAKFGPLIISGFFGWILKGLVDFYYLLSVLPNRLALRIWLKGFKIFIKND